MIAIPDELRVARYAVRKDPTTIIEVNRIPYRPSIYQRLDLLQAWPSPPVSPPVRSVTRVLYAFGSGEAAYAYIAWSMKQQVPRSSCEKPRSDMSVGVEANDYRQRHAASMLAAPPEHARTSLTRFKLLSGAELCNAQPMRWMVRGVLPMEGLAALYGPSGSGKSFLTLDLGSAVARGDDWFGRRVQQCPVTYVCLEGEQGMSKRVKAWSLHHGTPVPEALQFVTQPFDLRKVSDVTDLAEAIKAARGAGGLVILDTLNRAAPGVDENSSVDMGKIIAAAKHMQSLTGGLVLLVHHTGKDANKGLRGHSSLHAALDSAIEVCQNDGCRTWRIAKSKDDETGCIRGFKLHAMTVGVDEEGDEITSCAVLPDDTVEEVKRTAMPRGENQRIAVNVIDGLLRDSQEYDQGGAPAERRCIRLDDAINAVAARVETDAKHKKQRAKDAVSAVLEKGIYGCKDGWLWRT
jgi:hypothetical protein